MVVTFNGKTCNPNVCLRNSCFSGGRNFSTNQGYEITGQPYYLFAPCGGNGLMNWTLEDCATGAVGDTVGVINVECGCTAH